MRWRGLEPPRACAHKALNLARLPIPPPARGARLYPEALATRAVGTGPRCSGRRAPRPTVVRRVRLRSTMCVPPCDCGVKPMPPKPASRPGMHQHERDEGSGDQHLHDCKERGPSLAGWYQRLPSDTLAMAAARPRRPCHDPASARDRRQPAQAGSQAGEGARELHGGARGGAGGGARGGRAAARRAQAGRSRAARSQKLLHPLRLPPDVVRLGGAPRLEVRSGQRRGLLEAGRERRRRPAGRRARPRSARHELRRPADAASRRPAGPTPALRASRARTARRGSAGRPRLRPRSRPRRDRARPCRRHGFRDVPRARPAAGRRRRRRARPRPAARRHARGGGRSCARSASRRRRKPVPSGDQPTSARAAAESRSANRSRSTPQSITELFGSGLRHYLDQAVRGATPTPRRPRARA